MKRSCHRLLGLSLAVGFMSGCIPAPIPSPTPTSEEQEERLNRERYQARIRVIPGAPQAISGFLRIGRVYASRMGSAAVVSRVGNPRDLDIILDTINEYTEIEADFAPDLPYSDPRLLDLPIIIPQSEPNEVELEQLTRYLLEGGFVLDPGLGTDVFREGLEKYGGLVWGQDAWMETLPSDHPVFNSFFVLGEVRPSAGQPSPRGLFVNGRLAVLNFETLGMREEQTRAEVSRPGQVPGRAPVSPGTETVDPQLLRELDAAHVDRFRDIRFEKMTVNVVVHALTQEGSITSRNSTGGR